MKVEILIGHDVYWKFMTPEMVCLPEGLVAQRSMFGWVLPGPLPANSPTVGVSNEVSHQLFCMNVSESGLTILWNLESVGIHDREASAVDPVLRFNYLTAGMWCHCHGSMSQCVLISLTTRSWHSLV